MASFSAARTFVFREARLVERRLFATLFEGASPDGVVRALEAYRNDDGGFGHGLEPDVRCPDSQPLDVATALELLALAGAPAAAIGKRACGFLQQVADERGAVPHLLRSALDYPHAGHMGLEPFYTPSVWPTAYVAGFLHGFGVRHPWLDRATAFCLDELEREPPGDAHAIRDALRFLHHAPDRGRADALLPTVAARLDGAVYFLADPADPAYGVTPLEIPGARELFPAAQLDAHLDRLEAEQADDGGWPLRWEPPSAASVLDWRGNRTVAALHTLREYGRL